MAYISEAEIQECKSRAEAATQILYAYYQWPGTFAYNLDEALDTLVTLTERRQKTVHLEQQKHYAELSRKPLV